ncbi:hypothetical protein N431DRAFT_354052 [Stipitochalara longipes BDJ]|nr:hypothetical protein N431DRAFT_354052 [Stipitochalara longipes BDJ]
MKHYDPVVEDRIEIEKQLQSGTSVLVLEVPKSTRSHCKASFCFPQEIGDGSKIYSSFRFNLKDLTGERVGAMAHWRQPDRFYHVSCFEQIMDCSTLLQKNQLKYEGGHAIVTSIYGIQVHYRSVHMAIVDWFDNKGCSFDISAYVQHEEAYDQWVTSQSEYLMKHEMHAREGVTDCSCGPVPAAPTYSGDERQSRLLSEVLASIVKRPQIDSIPVTWLEYLRPQYKQRRYKQLGSPPMRKSRRDVKS